MDNYKRLLKYAKKKYGKDIVNLWDSQFQEAYGDYGIDSVNIQDFDDIFEEFKEAFKDVKKVKDTKLLRKLYFYDKFDGYISPDGYILFIDGEPFRREDD